MEGSSAMGPQNSSGDNKLNFYMQFAIPLIVHLPNSSDRLKAASWISKIKTDSASEDVRTDYLKLLIFALHRKRLVGPFQESPGDDELGELPQNAKLVDLAHDMIILESAEKSRRDQNNKGDFPFYTVELSGNLLEFASSQVIPGFGGQAFHAISNLPIQNWENVGLVPNEILAREDGTPTLAQMFRKRKATKSDAKIDKNQAKAQKTKSDLVLKPLSLGSPNKLSCSQRQPITWGSNLIEVTDPVSEDDGSGEFPRLPKQRSPSHRRQSPFTSPHGTSARMMANQSRMSLDEPTEVPHTEYIQDQEYASPNLRQSAQKRRSPDADLSSDSAAQISDHDHKKQKIRQIKMRALDHEANKIIDEANVALAEQESSQRHEPHSPKRQFRDESSRSSLKSPSTPSKAAPVRTTARSPVRTPRRTSSGSPGKRDSFPRNASRKETVFKEEIMEQGPSSALDFAGEEPLEILFPINTQFNAGSFEDEEAPEFYDDHDDSLHKSLEKQILQIQQEFAIQTSSLPAASGVAATTPSLGLSPIRLNDYGADIFDEEVPDFYSSPSPMDVDFVEAEEEGAVGGTLPKYDFDVLVLHRKPSVLSSTTSSYTPTSSSVTLTEAPSGATLSDDDIPSIAADEVAPTTSSIANDIYNTLIAQEKAEAKPSSLKVPVKESPSHKTPKRPITFADEDDYIPYTLDWQTPPHLKSPEEAEQDDGPFEVPDFSFGASEPMEEDFLGSELVPSELYSSPPPAPVTPPHGPEPMSYEDLYDPFQNAEAADNLMDDDEEPLAAIVEAHEMYPYRTHEFTIKVGARARTVKLPWRSAPPGIEPISEEPEFYHLQSPPRTPPQPTTIDYNAPYMPPAPQRSGTVSRPKTPTQEKTVAQGEEPMEQDEQIEQNILNDVQEHFVANMEDAQQMGMLERVVQIAVEAHSREGLLDADGDAIMTLPPPLEFADVDMIDSTSPVKPPTPTRPKTPAQHTSNASTRPKTPPALAQRGTQYTSMQSTSATQPPQFDFAGSVGDFMPEYGMFDFGQDALDVINMGSPPIGFADIDFIDSSARPTTPLAPRQRTPTPKAQTPEFDFGGALDQFMPEYGPLGFGQEGNLSITIGSPPPNFEDIEMIEASPAHQMTPTHMQAMGQHRVKTPSPKLPQFDFSLPIQHFMPEYGPMDFGGDANMSMNIASPPMDFADIDMIESENIMVQSPSPHAAQYKSPSPRSPQFKFAGPLEEFMPEYGAFDFGLDSQEIINVGTPPAGFEDIEMIDACQTPTTPLVRPPTRLRTPTPRAQTPQFDFAEPVGHFMPEYGPLDFASLNANESLNLGSPPAGFIDIEMIEAYSRPITPQERTPRVPQQAPRTPTPRQPSPQFDFAGAIDDFMPEYGAFDFGEGDDEQVFIATPPAGFQDIEMIDACTTPTTPPTMPLPLRFGTPPPRPPARRFDFSQPIEHFMPEYETQGVGQGSNNQQISSPSMFAMVDVGTRPMTPPAQSPRVQHVPVSPRTPSPQMNIGAPCGGIRPEYEMPINVRTPPRAVQAHTSPRISPQQPQGHISPVTPIELVARFPGWATPEHLQVERTPPNAMPRTPPRIYRPDMIYGVRQPSTPPRITRQQYDAAMAIFDSGDQQNEEDIFDDDMLLYDSPLYESAIGSTLLDSHSSRVISPGTAAEQASRLYDAGAQDYGQWNQIHDTTPLENMQMDDLPMHRTPTYADQHFHQMSTQAYEDTLGIENVSLYESPYYQDEQSMYDNLDIQYEQISPGAAAEAAGRAFDVAAQEYAQYDDTTQANPEVLSTTTTTTTVTEEVYYEEEPIIAPIPPRQSPRQPAYELQWNSPPRETLPQYEKYMPPPLFKPASPVTPPQYVDVQEPGIFDETPPFYASPRPADIFANVHEPYEGIDDADIQLYESPQQTQESAYSMFDQATLGSPYGTLPYGAQQRRRTPQDDPWAQPGPSCRNPGCSK